VSRKIVKEVFVQAPPDVVWRALTDAQELTRWFPVDARVQPGKGGSIWLSWGGGTEGSAPITEWEPSRRLQWTETRGAVKLAVDFHLEAKSGGTVVRLVNSGFGAGSDWDDEFHMTDGGWSYFIQHLRWYLEQHAGTPRDLIAFRERVTFTRAEAFLRLTGPSGLSADDALAAASAGMEYQTTTAQGEPLSGTIVASSPDTWQLGFTVRELGDAIVFLEMEPDAGGSRPGFWLSTYGLAPDGIARARERFEALYRTALELA
jgi:uncharacterized protein YndB with AHSA1/START domain